MARFPDISRSRGDVLVAVVAAAGLVTAAVSGGSYSVLRRSELFVVVLWVLVMALALGLVPRHRVPRAGLVSVGALAGLACWGAIGLAWTESAERTVAEVARTIGFAGLLLLVMCTMGGRGWRTPAAGVAAAAAIVCWLAFVSRLAPDLLPSALAESGLRLRLSYPLDYWNALGIMGRDDGRRSAWRGARMPRPGSSAASRWRRCASRSRSPTSPTRERRPSPSASRSSRVVTLSRHRWQAVLNAGLAGVGAAVVVLVIRAHPQIAEGTGTRGAVAVGLACAGVALAAMLAAATGLTQLLDDRRMDRRAARAALVAAAVLRGRDAGVVAGPAVAGRAWDSFAQPRGEPGAPTTPPGGCRR